MNGSVVRCVSDNYWKLRVPKHLAELPRLKGLIQDIMAEPCLKLDLLPSQSLASKILERANLVIRGLASSSYFKIGLTSNPVHRWSNDGYGYLHSSNPSWNEMRIVGILASGEAAGFLEAALIDRWQRDNRCTNSASGGEGISTQEGYLSPTPGPPRRRAAETAKQEEASPKTPKQTLLKLKPMDPDEGDDKDDQADKPKPKRAKKSSDAQKKENADAEKKKKEKNPNDTDAEKKEKKPDDADAEKKEKKPDDAVAEKKEKKPDDAEKKKEKKPDDADAEKKEKKHHDADEKKEKKPDDCHKKKEKKPDDADAEHDEKMPDDADKSKEAAGDIKWNPELGKACWQKKEGVIISSVPFVDKDDEVKVSFGGLLWSVPHLVPSDLDSSMPPKNPMQTQTKVKAVPKAKQLKPVDDYIYPIIRCKYCTQGSKNPLIKIEVREDRHNLRSKWVQKLQLVVKDNLSVQKAMHIAKSFADSYVYMNLNPGFWDDCVHVAQMF
ncbi:cpt [Symbiodinium sp. CCMP2592]|nr:cpt [Symbiodinium sp. CCMP2592]